MEQKPEKINHGWHLDKRVPVTLIIAIVIQLITFTWWMSSLASDIENNSDNIARHEVQIQLIRESSSEQARMLSRIEEQIIALRRDLQFTVDQLIPAE